MNFNDLCSDIIISLSRVLFWTLISFLFGIIAGLGLKKYKLIYKLLIHPINFIKQISPFAWMPLAIIIFGISELSVGFVLLISMILPSALLTLDLLNSLSKEVIEEAKSAGAHGWDLFWHIELPLARLGLINQSRLLWSIGWNTLIAAEMLGVSKGLGFRLLDFRYLLAYKEMLIYIAIIGFIGIVTDYLLVKISNNYQNY
jgi:ABC-type nitrate/sulfonate/bicarbonate transport system permease component